MTSSSTVVVREAREDEIEDVVRVLAVTFEQLRPSETDPIYERAFDRYFEEIDARFESGFDPAHALPLDAADMTEPAGLLLVARLRGDPVGCGALKFYARKPAYLKRMWIAPAARGLGLGRRLLSELEEQARRHGARAVQLETNGALHEAIALYRSSGYTEVEPFNAEPYAHHWFEKPL